MVISIVGLLAGLAVPAVQKARNTADTAGCQSNLRQVFLATQSSASDNGGKYIAFKIFPWVPNGTLNYKAGERWGAQPEPGSCGEVLAPYLNISPIRGMDIDPAQIPQVLRCPAAQNNKKMSESKDMPKSVTMDMQPEGRFLLLETRVPCS